VSEPKHPKFLVCPLDWGLGHATRIIPLVHKLVELNCEVVLAVSGESGELLKEEFPGLSTVHLPSFTIRYSRRNSQVLSILIQIPRFLMYSFYEHRQLKEILQREKFHVVISDQRFGLWNKKAYSVFLTHQLHVKFPFKIKTFEKLFNFFQHKILKRYDECWVPDTKNTLNLAGDLSEKTKMMQNLHYIGIQSRFKSIEKTPTKQGKIKLLALLSGPEPQRTVLENKIENQLKALDKEAVIVRGSRRAKKKMSTNNLTYYNYLKSDELEQLIRNSDFVICRSGYSTLMDLVTLQKRALLVPTPGQPEQEYLAEYLKARGHFYAVSQNKLNLFKDLDKASEYHPPDYQNTNYLEDRLKSITGNLRSSYSWE
jgi:predicted glycosyltransferase